MKLGYLSAFVSLPTIELELFFPWRGLREPTRRPHTSAEGAGLAQRRTREADSNTGGR